MILCKRYEISTCVHFQYFIIYLNICEVLVCEIYVPRKKVVYVYSTQKLEYIYGWNFRILYFDGGRVLAMGKVRDDLYYYYPWALEGACCDGISASITYLL